jgi:hypothetical protein
MWRKAAFSHGELLTQMSQEEKEMMRLTFQKYGAQLQSREDERQS